MFRYYGNAEKEISLLGKWRQCFRFFFLVEIWGLADIAGDGYLDQQIPEITEMDCLCENEYNNVFFYVEYNPIFHDAFYI